MNWLVSKRAFLLLMLLAVFTVCLVDQAADASVQVSEKDWQQIVNDKDFGYKHEKEMRTRQKPIAENFFSKAIGLIIAFFSSPIGKTLVWVFVFAVAGYALFKILLSGKGGIFQKSAKGVSAPQETGEKQIDDIMTTDWDALLKESINAGDVRMAIRYSYLFLLQLMQRKQMINYRADKTNYDYYYELKDNTIKSSFKQITRHYEYSWYGNYPIPDQAYNGYLSEFNQLKLRLQNS